MTVFTYCISDGLGHVKVGKSEDIESRLRALQTSNPSQLRVVGKIDANRERDIHVRYGHLRIRGEWFTETAELLAEFGPAPEIVIKDRDALTPVMLRKREVEILELRRNHSLESVAQAYGATRERVKQIEKSAERKLTALRLSGL